MLLRIITNLVNFIEMLVLMGVFLPFLWLHSFLIMVYGWFVDLLWFMRHDLTGKPVFITGCDSGFGFSTAVKLVKRGAKVYANCYSEKGAQELIKACTGFQQGDLRTMVFDVRDESKVRAAREEIEKADGYIYAVINNAGIATFGCVEGTTMEEFRRVMDINFFAGAFVCKEFLPLLRKYGSNARIVNVSSVGGRITGSGNGVGAYCAAKFAMEAFSDTLRRELFGEDISVSVIEPAYFKTPLIADLEARTRAAFDSLSPELQGIYSNLMKKAEQRNKLINAIAEDPDIVSDAIVRNTRSRYPVVRYPVGKQANIMYVPLSQAPTNIQDFFFRYN